LILIFIKINIFIFTASAVHLFYKRLASLSSKKTFILILNITLFIFYKARGYTPSLRSPSEEFIKIYYILYIFGIMRLLVNCSAQQTATYYCYSANSELFNSSSDNQITTQNNSDNNANPCLRLSSSPPCSPHHTRPDHTRPSEGRKASFGRQALEEAPHHTTPDLRKEGKLWKASFGRQALEGSNNSGGKKNDKELAFVQWLAGLIDGDGYFILTKKGYASCEITMDARDKKALYEIKQKYGGSIKLVSNANALRYKLRHKKGLISLINDVNGLLRNPARLLQINKLCVKYNIELKYPKPLTFNNG
jgi:hypothetical protein